MRVKKRTGNTEEFDIKKIENVIFKVLTQCKHNAPRRNAKQLAQIVQTQIESLQRYTISVEKIQDVICDVLIGMGYNTEVKAFVAYREERARYRAIAKEKHEFINNYKASSNNANATVDDNSNVGNKNIGVMNAEIHKKDNIQLNRAEVMNKLKELNPGKDYHKQYIRDLNNHIIYKHDESSFGGTPPYCASITMYPFLNNGLKDLGGLSAKPKNLDSFCGMYTNMIFAISAQFAGAIATSELFIYFDYFARKEWGNDYHKNVDNTINTYNTKTIRQQIHQYFQQIVYSINQPTGARGLQSAFVNFSYFDSEFYDSMFGRFTFEDGTAPQKESIMWLQKDFMMWFNEERTKCMLTFPVESAAMIYKDGKFQDEEFFDFICQEYARGHSFFTYISDTADSLSSCCRLKNAINVKEFSFTNGNISLQSGSKSVITLNLSRIIQNICRDWSAKQGVEATMGTKYMDQEGFKEYMDSQIVEILERVYKYHEAYNELLWDLYNAGMLPVYSAGFINLNKQYLTIGLNGLNEAAEFMGMKCNDNEDYKLFCENIFSTIKEQNTLHKTKKMMFNTEQVPAESLAVKNYNWDKEDGYWVPEGRNLYASYIFIPSDKEMSILEKIRLHGKDYIGEYLDGGSAAHLNLDSHLSAEQYKKLLTYAAEQGCQYLTYNIPNSECQDCGYITKVPIAECPKCGSKHIDYYDRIIGYLTKISNWSDGRQKEQKTRVYKAANEVGQELS